MSTETALAIRNATLSTLPTVSTEDIEKALTIGDLAKMPADVRIRYYLATCQSAGLNPMTQPFTPMKNQAGQVILYANKEAAEQLRKRDRVSIRVLSRTKEDGLYLVTVAASTPDGRCEEAQGIVDITGLKGQALANAMMKAETKAKRRVTMALCGLGFPMDDDAPGHPVALNYQTGELPMSQEEQAESLALTEPRKTLADHIADVSGDPLPARPSLATAQASPVGAEITATMDALGWSADKQARNWQTIGQKYPDLTPGALAITRDYLEAQLAARQAIEESPILEEKDAQESQSMTYGNLVEEDIPF